MADNSVELIHILVPLKLILLISQVIVVTHLSNAVTIYQSLLPLTKIWSAMEKQTYIISELIG